MMMTTTMPTIIVETIIIQELKRSTDTTDKGEEKVMKQRVDALQYVVDGIEVSESDIITESARTSS